MNAGSEPMSSSQAGVYQQLRAHLAYLKLGTAAEELPGNLISPTSKPLSNACIWSPVLLIPKGRVRQSGQCGGSQHSTPSQSPSPTACQRGGQLTMNATAAAAQKIAPLDVRQLRV